MSSMTSTAQSYEDALLDTPEARGEEVIEEPYPDEDLEGEDLDEDGEIITFHAHPDDLRDAYYDNLAERRKEDRELGYP